jgi:hypothetical protein
MVTSSDTGAVAVEPSDSVDVRVSDLVSPAVSPVWPATPDSLPVTGVGALRLQADALDSTWVQVQWDGVDGFEEIIPQGERRTWAADRYFMVRAGRAHGVHFHFQGQLLGEGRLGDPTKVLRFRASADGVQLLGPDLEPIAPIAQVQPDTMESSPPGVR